MRKSEVYNNIRYNENLVNQYQNSINNYRSHINSLISQINSTNSSIKVLCDQKNKLYTQINELNYLKSKYQNLQSKFSQRQTSRINTLNGNFSRELNVQFIKSYVKGMSSLLGGNEYRNAYNGLTNAINVISDKIK